MMKRKTLFWILAPLITLIIAYYQRSTGPTKPVSHHVRIAGRHIEARLPRSHGGETDREIRIRDVQPSIEGMLVYKRHKTSEPPDTIMMSRLNGELVGYLPNQPPAGKLEYQVILLHQEQTYPLNEVPVIIRFKGAVPSWVLLPHILLIFSAQLLSLLAGLFAIFRLKGYKLYGYLTLGMILVGGLILGPVIQKYAFGAYWTGFPLGQDLTDNKVAFAALFWVLAVVMNLRKDRPVYTWLAAGVFLLVNLIPHSLLGSELDYESGEVVTGMILIF